MDDINVAMRNTAMQIIETNQEIGLMLEQWVKCSAIVSDTPASSIPGEAIQLMKRVDALLLTIGHSPKYTHIIAKHGMEGNPVNQYFSGE